MLRALKIATIALVRKPYKLIAIQFKVRNPAILRNVHLFGESLAARGAVKNGQRRPSLREKALKVNRLFRIGAAELGNWNATGSPDQDPSRIRNFSGAMDEFCLCSRALNAGEIRALHSAGKPQPDPVAALNKN